MDITGMSEEQYRWFVRECYKNQKLRPGEPVALEPATISLILTAVSILLSAAAMLLTPKPKDQEQKTPEEETIEGQNVVRRDRFAPKSGFDSFQNVVDMGSVVPIIYAKQEDIDGETYGGLRVNTNLLWSQVLSVGGGQFFRGIFLIGEGPLNLAEEQLALGNNTLASYELVKDAEAGRITYYFEKDGGRINSGDYRRGVIVDNDPGAFSPGDIYQVDDGPHFCQALQPSNQVEFGVYGHIGNNFGYKIGEPFIPITQWQAGSEDQYERQTSNQKYAQGRKDSLTYTTRCGFIRIDRKDGSVVEGDEQNQSVDVGDKLTYVIYPTSEYDRVFREGNSTSGEEPESRLNNHDVATTIASIQRGFDENINVGALYKAGSAIVVCTERGDMFVSDVDFDGDGSQMEATFEVIEGGEGELDIWDVDSLNYQNTDNNAGNATKDDDFDTGKLCSKNSQLFQLLVAAFSVERAFKTIEVGLQSNVGLKTSGVTNFNSLVAERAYISDEQGGSDDEGIPDYSYQAYIDAEFCGGQEPDDNGDMEAQDEAYRKEILPGTYSAADTRFSFFRIYHRDIGEETFEASNHLYSIRSATGVDVYNFLRFKFDDSKRREFRFMPISSWEVRNDIGSWDRLYAIDAHDSTERIVDENGYIIEFTGALIDNPEEEFAVKAFQPPEEREVEECTTREETVIDQEIDIVNPGQGYSAVGGVPIPDPDNAGGTLLVETYYPVTMVSTTGQGENFTALVGVRAPETDPTNGFVAIVLIDPYDSSDLMGYVDGTQVRFQSDAAVGGGFGFVGRVSIRDRVITECETVTLGNPQLGIAPPDDNVTGQESYVDGYARIAEAFIYDGVSTTASEPEHKISYINIITENETPPQYDEMALVGLNIRSSKELRSLDQLSVYVQEGVIDSHLFPDVFYDLLTQDRYGTGEFFDEQQIDIDSFNAAATWTEARRYFFDGAISDKINLRTWGAERARDFLLDLSISSGQFTSNPPSISMVKSQSLRCTAAATSSKTP